MPSILPLPYMHCLRIRLMHWYSADTKAIMMGVVFVPCRDYDRLLPRHFADLADILCRPGANIQCSPDLRQFAAWAARYRRRFNNRPILQKQRGGGARCQAHVGLLNIGKTWQAPVVPRGQSALEQDGCINCIGHRAKRAILSRADVVVCDGYTTGFKTIESMAGLPAN